MNIRKLLTQPFPLVASLKGKLSVAGLFGLFIWCFLVFFQPFELDSFPFSRRLLVTFIYGLITASCVLIATVLFPLVYPAIFEENKWTTGKQILLITGVTFFIGLFNYLASPLLVQTRLNLEDALWFQLITLAIAWMPVTLFILLRQNQLLRKFRLEGEFIDKKLHQKQNDEYQIKANQQAQLNETIKISGDYQHEMFEIRKDDLCAVVSASNYVKIYYLQNERLIYSVVRLTLKRAEDLLAAHNNFLRCHRAYIINLDKVIHVEGNAQGLKIQIDKMEELIPVSRNFNTEFSDRLLAIRNKMQFENQVNDSKTS